MTESIHKHCILILDFGSQCTQLVARRVRELGVYCELWAWDTTEAQTRGFNPSGTILPDGPESITEEDSPCVPRYVLEAGVPIFGVCYGMQTMAMQLGGHVGVSSEREFDYVQVEVVSDSAPVCGVEDALTVDGEPLLGVWMSHGDKVTAILSDLVTVANTGSYPLAIIANKEKCFYGVRFHPEVTHARQNMRVLERFVRGICQCEALQVSAKIIDDTVARIRERVGDGKVIPGLSDDVDPFITTMLLHRAISKNLTCVFVDNGLLCLNEAEQVLDMFGDHFGLNIARVSAEDHFSSTLAGENDSEAKCEIIGRAFVEVFNEEAMKLEDVKWLAQGIIYPNVTESVASVTGKAHVIKSHHNVGNLPKEMKMGLAGPLKELFKDEVRRVGLELSLPYNTFYRHPLPGPGLGIRVSGEAKKEYCNLLHRADAIFIEELCKVDLYGKVSQAFTVLLSVCSVGIMGDGRRYDWVASLCAVGATDFMTTCWAHLSYDFLGRVSNHIINEVNGISRMVYDTSGKPPATVKWE